MAALRFPQDPRKKKEHIASVKIAVIAPYSLVIPAKGYYKNFSDIVLT